MYFEDLLLELDSPEFSSLRPMQADVLTQYTKLLGTDRTEIPGDVAIEMPAGTGKTLIALLIAEHHRRLDLSIAILTGTRQLAHQVAEDATDLGIETVVFEGRGVDWSRRDLRRYREAEVSAIMNYWAYFNTNPTPTPAEVLIFDDAHIAENAMSALFSISISRSERADLYLDIIRTIQALRPGRYTLIEDILRNDVQTQTTLPLPFYDWFEILDEVVSLLDEASLEGADSVRFTWPRIRDSRDALALYVSSYEVLLRPVVYATQNLRHMNEALHRIYLSATLGDKEDFERRIGCPPVELLRPADPTPGERGRRMIVLFPSSEEGSDTEQIVRRGLRRLWPVARKRLWMCCSWQEVTRWKHWVPPLRGGSRSHIFELKDPVGKQLEEFYQARRGHLFTAARYDGMDFPEDHARLAILPSPPVTCDPQEEFFSSYLRDATFLKSRFSQRVAQALGRCNRGNADFAAYVLLHPRFERVFGGNDRDYMAFLPQDIHAEMEAALENCDEGFENSCAKAESFLSGEFRQWDTHVEEIRSSQIRQDRVPQSYTTAQHEVAGWLAFWRGDPVRAGQQFLRVEGTIGALGVSGFLAFTKYCRAWARFACHLRQGEALAFTEALELLEEAATLGPSSWFTNLLRASANDLAQLQVRPSQRERAGVLDPYVQAVLEAWDDIMFERGIRPAALNRWLDKIERKMESDHHDEVREATDELGRLLGFESCRPNNSGMPDVFWRFSRGPWLLITLEIKAKLNEDRRVALRDVNQAHGQGRWAAEAFPQYDCIPLILTRSTEFEPGVQDRLGNVACLTQATAASLVRGVRGLFDQFRRIWRSDDSQTRLEAKNRTARDLPQLNWITGAYSLTRNGFIDEGTFLSSWQS